MTIGYFEESPGVKSIMRLMCFILLWYGLILTSYFAVTKGSAEAIEVFSTIMVFVFGGKIAQKAVEKPGMVLPGYKPKPDIIPETKPETLNN